MRGCWDEGVTGHAICHPIIPLIPAPPHIPLMSLAASSALALAVAGSTASRTLPFTRRVLPISLRRDSITLSSRERIVGYDTPTCSAISLRLPPESTNISMNRWCSTGRLASRDIGNAASTDTAQCAHVIRVTAIPFPQYGQSWPIGRCCSLIRTSLSLFETFTPRTFIKQQKSAQLFHFISKGAGFPGRAYTARLA